MTLHTTHRLIGTIILICASLCGCVTRTTPEVGATDILQRAFNERRSNVQVTGQGQVSRILSDDNSGSRHQRFVLLLPSGQTILIQHNIDLAPRVPDLKTGDTVHFNGEYEWNEQGGLIHWTHHDPAKRHPDGWLKHNGRTFQ